MEPNPKVNGFKAESLVRISEGRSPSKECANIKPCKGVRIMRAALSGLKIIFGRFVGLRPTLNRVALSGRKTLREPFNYTEWQKQMYKGETVTTLFNKVKAFEQTRSNEARCKKFNVSR